VLDHLRCAGKPAMDDSRDREVPDGAALHRRRNFASKVVELPLRAIGEWSRVGALRISHVLTRALADDGVGLDGDH
jgi:hypothetical protein